MPVNRGHEAKSFVIWVYRHLLKIPWTNLVTHVLKTLTKEMGILKTNKRRKLKYLRHIMRHPEKYELWLKFSGKLDGNRELIWM